MNLPEVAALLGLIATYDGREVSDAHADAWLLVIGDVAFDVAVQAVHDHYRRVSKRIYPADIVAHDRALRTARADKAASTALRAGVIETSTIWQAAFNGQPFTLPAPIPRKTLPIDDLPPPQATRLHRRRAILAVPCPWCRAPIGQACTVSGTSTAAGGAVVLPPPLPDGHPSRQEAAGVRNPAPPPPAANPHYQPATAANPPTPPGDPDGAETRPPPDRAGPAQP